MKIRGLIFDFDGLILDTEGSIFQSWQELYQSYGCSLALNDWSKIIGTADLPFDPRANLEKEIGHTLDWQPIEKGRRNRELELIADLRPLPGVEAYLQDAKRLNLKVALASSSTCEWVTGYLKRLRLIQYFDCILAGDDVLRTKPDPALFKEACTCLELRARQVIVFEDSLNGVKAAKAANMFCVAVPNYLTENMPLEEYADLRLDSLQDLRLEALIEQVELIRSREQ